MKRPYVLNLSEETLESLNEKAGTSDRKVVYFTSADECIKLEQSGKYPNISFLVWREPLMI